MTDKTIPAGADPDNTLILETGPGVIVIKLRNDLAPGHAERLKQLAREGFYDDVLPLSAAEHEAWKKLPPLERQRIIGPPTP